MFSVHAPQSARDEHEKDASPNSVSDTLTTAAHGSGRINKEAKRSAKKANAAARSVHYDKTIRNLEHRGEDRTLFGLMKLRHLQTQDVEKFHCVDEKMEISTEEFPHPPIESAPPIDGSILCIDTVEVTVGGLVWIRTFKNMYLVVSNAKHNGQILKENYYFHRIRHRDRGREFM
ncbi:hypothetical protein ACOME3_004505 [Neoechinorhynchus agilis]